MSGGAKFAPPLFFRGQLYYCMKIKNRDVIEILSTLNLMARQKLPVKMSWRIETARNAIRPFADTAIKMIDGIKKEKAMKDLEGRLLMSKDDKGNDIPDTLVFDRGVIDEVNKEIDSLLDEEVEISNVELKFEDFPDTLELTANEVRTLNKIIE